MIVASLILGALLVGVAWSTRVVRANAHTAPFSEFFGIGRVFAIIRAVRNGSILRYMDLFWPMYGDTYTMSIMGTKVTFTRDATIIKKVLTTNLHDFDAATGIRAPLWEYLAPGTVAALDGKGWEDERRKWRRAVVPLDGLFDKPFFETAFEKLVHRIPKGQFVDVQRLCLDMGTDIISNLTVGKSLNCIDPENQSPDDQKFVTALARASPVSARRGFLGRYARLSPDFGYKADCDIVTGHVARLSQERLLTLQEQKNDELDGAPRPQTFLERLLMHESDTTMVNRNIVSLMMGNEETVRPVAHAIFYLSRNPTAYQKLRDSVLDLVGYEAPTYEQLTKFSSVRNVINECKDKQYYLFPS